MTPNYDFAKDNARAQKDEQLIGRWFSVSGYTLKEQNNGKNIDQLKKWDLRFEDDYGSEITVELKTDYSCEKTGNVAFENARVPYGKQPVNFNAIPSGIEVTEADYIVYLVAIKGKPNTFSGYMGDKPTFLEMMDKKCLREVWGGDGNRTRNVLVRLGDFTSYPGIYFMGEVERPI